MFDLQARVHLEKVERPVAVEQELNRAGVGVTDGLGHRRGRRGHAPAQLRRHRQRGTLFDHLLVTTLNGTFALDERQHRAVVIAEQLHLDMTGRENPPLQIDGTVAKRRLRLGARRAQGRGQLSRRRHHAHALAAATSDRLEHQRIPDALRHLQHVSVRRLLAQGFFGPGHDRHPGLDRGLPRGGLAAHQGDGFRRRADEHQSGITARRREVFVLGQEPVARMHGIRARLLRRVDGRIDAQITLARRTRAHRPRFVRKANVQRGTIALRVDGDRRNAHVAAGTNHTHSDLAAIGDQDLLHWAEPLTILSVAGTDVVSAATRSGDRGRRRNQRRSRWAVAAARQSGLR